MAQRKYDKTLKQEVIDAELIGVCSAAEVERGYDLPRNAIYSCIRQYKQENDLAILHLKMHT